jgi:hypothetical protein
MYFGTTKILVVNNYPFSNNRYNFSNINFEEYVKVTEGTIF